MTSPDYSSFTDTTRPRPVRIAAFCGFLAQAVLIVLATIFRLDPMLVRTLLAVIALGQVGGWLFVETRVTPTSSPAAIRNGKLVPLTPARSMDRGVEYPGGAT